VTVQPKISVAELCALVGAEPAPAHPAFVVGISTDSRTVGPGELFIPLRGEHFDGHDYVRSAFARGAALALADREVEVPHLRVADTLAAYQALGRWWRDRFDLPVVAVTGSAGKTTTRELIRAVLATAGPTLASEGNENNDVGVPKLLLRLERTHRSCVVEMGMRGEGEIARLTRAARPTVGVITNVGSAHIGRLGSYEAIARAKCELLAEMDPHAVAVLNSEDERLNAAARRVWFGTVITYGLDAGDVRGHFDGERLWVDGVDFHPPLPGRHNLMNFLAALAVARHLGLDLGTVRDRLGEVNLPAGRSRVTHLSGGIALVDETYNSSPESARAALHLLAGLPADRRFAVLGQMRELGDFSAELHRALGEECRKLGIDGLYVLEADGDSRALVAGAAPLATRVYSDCGQLATELAAAVRPGDAVLFKASRAIGLERAVAAFSRAVESAQ